MANWCYYNNAGEKVGPVSGAALKELALEGIITPETKLENSNGRIAVAGQVSGLIFPETKQLEAAVYGSEKEFNFPEFTTEGSTSPDYAQSASVTPPVISTVIDSGNAIDRKTSRAANQTKCKPALLDWILLDFRFRFFLTPLFLKIIWCSWVVLTELLIVTLVLGLMFSGIASMLPEMSGDAATNDWESPSRHNGSGGGFIGFWVTRFLPLVMIPLFTATFLLCIRIALESVMIVFRIGEHLKNIDEKT